jgi:hypothetical protein
MSSSKVPGVLAASFAAAVSLFAAACGQRSQTIPASEGASAAPSGEAAQTQQLEQKADDYQARMQAIQASDMSAEEKVQAANALVDEQQKTIQEAVDSPPADSAGDPPH